jgi:hypothetical protein
MSEVLRLLMPLFIVGLFVGWLGTSSNALYLVPLFLIPLALLYGYFMVKGESYEIRSRKDKNLTTLLGSYTGGWQSFLFEGDRVRGQRRQHSARDIAEFAEKTKDLAELKRIADFVEARIQERLRARPRRDLLDADRDSQEVYQLQNVLVAAGSPNELALSREIASVTMHKYWDLPRGTAIDRIAKLGGAAELPFLTGLMDNPGMEPTVQAQVLHAFRSIGPAAGQPEIVDRVFKFMDTATDVYQKSAAAEVLVALRAAADPRLAPFKQAATPWAKFALRLDADKVDGSTLLTHLTEAGLLRDNLTASTKVRIRTRLQAGIDRADLFMAILAVLGRRKGFFNFETKHYDSGGYTEWLGDLAIYSAPRVAISNVKFNGGTSRQNMRNGVALEDNGEVQCTCASQLVVVKGLYTNWLYHAPLLVAFNEALAAAGNPCRFYDMESGGEDAYVFLANAAGMEKLISNLNFPFAQFSAQA